MIAVTFIFVFPSFIMIGLLGYSFYFIKKLENICNYTISTKYIAVQLVTMLLFSISDLIPAFFWTDLTHNFIIAITVAMSLNWVGFIALTLTLS